MPNNNKVKSDPLVSIAIPAYNNPEYTRKTLKSIISQSYRPIEVILSDDGSPDSLEFLVEEIDSYTDDSFIVRFYRHEVNLGPLENISFSALKAKGKYLILMPHDDWLTQSLFIKESVEIMENNNNCNLCCANSILESTGDPINKSLPSYLDAEKEWKILRGDKYIRLLGGRINFQAYSAVICNWHILKNMGAYRYPYCLDQGITKKLDILPDEGFVFQFLLSSIGSIAITNKIVSVRGQPPHSYSSSTSWQKVAGQALFMLMFNIYSSNLNGKYANVVKNRAKYWLIFYYPVERFNIKILKHYEYSFTAIGLMLASYLYSLLTRNYFSILLKIMFRTIKDKGIIYFLVKIIKLIKEKKLDII